jgi:hypothetical protein
MWTKQLSLWYVSSKVAITLLGQQTLHILYNKHEYGPMNAIMSLLHPVCKSWHMNSLANFYIQFFLQSNTIINEQPQTDVNPLFNLIYKYTTQTNMQMQRFPSTPLPFSVWFLYRGACWPNNINTTLLGMYHTDNCFNYMLKYIILSNNVLITSSAHIFLSFQDGDILHNSYKEFITKMFLYFIFWYMYFKPYILKLSISHLCISSKRFCNIYFVMQLVITCRRPTIFIYVNMIYNIWHS